MFLPTKEHTIQILENAKNVSDFASRMTFKDIVKIMKDNRGEPMETVQEVCKLEKPKKIVDTLNEAIDLLDKTKFYHSLFPLTIAKTTYQTPAQLISEYQHALMLFEGRAEVAINLKDEFLTPEPLFERGK